MINDLMIILLITPVTPHWHLRIKLNFELQKLTWNVSICTEWERPVRKNDTFWLHTSERLRGNLFNWNHLKQEALSPAEQGTSLYSTQRLSGASITTCSLHRSPPSITLTRVFTPPITLSLVCATLSKKVESQSQSFCGRSLTDKRLTKVIRALFFSTYGPNPESEIWD